MSQPDNRPMLYDWIRRETAGASCVVDFGAGMFDKLQFVPKMARKIGIEVFTPYHAFAAPGIRVVPHDMLRWADFIPERDRDCAMILDSLEHLTKEDGEVLLLTTGIWFKKTLVFTPDGFHEQEDDVTGYGNEWQRHMSGWSAEDLEAHGFTVEAAPGFHGDKGGALFAVRNGARP